MNEIPEIGLGTYRLLKDTYHIVLNALLSGYRHIDTAHVYRNEKEVGKAIKDSNVSRSEIFITTKICPSDIKKGRYGVIDAVKQSLKNLDSDYIDLVLLHVPVEEKNIEAWYTLEDIVNGIIPDCKVNKIGVSNYKINHLKEILNVCKIKPYCNQFEIHPFYKRTELTKFCKENDIKIVAYCSLVQGKVFNHQVLNRISTMYNITVSNLLLGWAREKGFIIIPRTSNLEHLAENKQINTIPDDVINELDKIHEEIVVFEKYY
jgi:methylglyoxal/glyoxal reductase